MKIFSMVVIALNTIFMVVGTVKAAQPVKEGQWSITTVIHMEGMGEESAQAQKDLENMTAEEKAMMQKMMGGMGMQMGASGQGMEMKTTHAQCITSDNPVPQEDDQKDCQQTHVIKGNTVNFEVICPDSKSTGQVTYTNETMTGKIKTTQTEGGQEKNMTIDLSGQYQGPCVPNVNQTITRKAAMVSGENKPVPQTKKPALEDANNVLNGTEQTVNTGHRVKNTFNGLRSLLGQ